MEPFLYSVAKDLLQRFDNQTKGLKNLTLLLPTQRAVLFFNRHLMSLVNRPVWQPRVRCITDLMFDIAKVRQAPPLLLCYKLYQSYLAVMQRNESFDDFFFWGNVMLSDFDQIDKYLVDSDKIFSNIADHKEIERRFDEFDEEHLRRLAEALNADVDSKLRSRYSEIWSRLFDIYSHFTDVLRSEGIAYEGMVYRMAAERLSNAHEAMLGTEQWAVVGFNAVSPCEHTLFEHLKAYNSALFYWDYDQYYTKEVQRHEAATFISDNLKRYGNQLSGNLFNNLSGSSKAMIAVDVPSNVAQAKVLPRILGEIEACGQPLDTKTAVVLLDESLLMPVLSALPTTNEAPNVTLEYPMRGTPAYALVDILFGLHQNSSAVALYHRDVLNLLNHPYVRSVCPDALKIRGDILKRKLISLPHSMFEADDVLAQLTNTDKRSPRELCQHFAESISLIANKLSQCEPTATADNDVPAINFERELLSAVYKALNGMVDLLSLVDAQMSARTLRLLFRRAMADERVSFVGEPLSGLQVMGLLETRNLDFDNVVMLSANDSVLPSVNMPPSFIMPMLRSYFGMPDYRHHAAIKAYYFYRLLQRAKRVYLVYDRSGEAGEESRYLKQLDLESPINIEKRSVSFTLGQPDEPQIIVPKTETIMQKLWGMVDGSISENGNRTNMLSATSLSRFKNCELRFYFDKIAGLREPDDTDEAIDARGMGTMVHKAIELIYNEAKDQITSEWLSLVKKDNERINRAIEQAFIDEYKTPPDDLIGRNKLIMERMRWMVRNVLEIDQQRVPYAIKANEQQVKTCFEIEANGESRTIWIGGYVDRQEMAADCLRIIDFKTGKYKDEKVKFNDINDLHKDKLDGVFQLMFYSEVIARSNGIDAEKIKPELWFVGSKNLPDLFYTENKKKAPIECYSSHRDAFIGLLNDLLQRLFDSNQPFRQTTEEKHCENCAYNGICRKEVKKYY